MIYLTQLVHVRPGMEATFHEFEDVVLPLLARHGGELLLRIRLDSESIVAASIEVPYEMHLVRFASEEGLQAFMSDPERLRVLHLRDASVESTLLVRGTV